MSADCVRPIGRAVTTVAALRDGLTNEQWDELLARLASRGYKPELSMTTRKAAGVTGGPIVAADAYRLFNSLPITFGGPELLKALRRPCCGLPDRTWIDPETGRVVEKAITHGRWKAGMTVTVAYRFGSIPDGADSITAAEVRACFQSALDCWMAVSGISLRLIDDFDRANIQIGDGREDGPFGTLAWMYLPVGAADESTRSRGHFDKDESWGLYRGGQGIGPREIDFLDVLIHELGHAWGMDHEPGNGAERLNPMYAHFPHWFSDRTHWIGPKDTATMRRVYGPPKAPPNPPAPAPPSGPTIGSVRVNGIFAGTARKRGPVYTLDGTLAGRYEPIG